jgi:hypothetical protein
MHIEGTEETHMLGKWIVLLATAALLSACATAPDRPEERRVWNGGIWNSTLGYIGPANVMVVGGP